MSARPVAPTPLVTTIALRFVAALQAGRRPSIEAALDSAPSSEWSGLLQSLLMAEVNDRLSRGETPHIREYLPRFPAHMAIVRTAFPSPQFASIAGPAIPTATLLRPGPTAFSAAPLAILPIPMLSTVPSPAIPIARAYVSPSAAVPMPIAATTPYDSCTPGMRIIRGSISSETRSTTPSALSISVRLRKAKAPRNTAPIHAARTAAGSFPVSHE